MKLTTTVFEGSTEEFLRIRQVLPDAVIFPRTEGLPPENGGSAIGSSIVEVLTRLPIPRGQKDLFRILYRLPQGEHIGKSELAERMGRSEQEFAGVLGALGRRVNNTASVATSPGIGLLVDFIRRDEQWHYRLTEDFRAVLSNMNFDWLEQ